MPLLPRLSSLWRNLFHKARTEQELTEELDAYLELLIEQKVSAGLAPEAARRAALLELGGKQQVIEQVREARVGHQSDTLLQDFQYGLRMLRRNPRFTLIAALTLALGIGANTAIFTVANAVLLRPLPYSHSERIVTIWSVNPKLHQGRDKVTNSPGQFIDYRDQSDAFDYIAAFNSEALNLEGKGAPEKLGTTLVTKDFFSVMGVGPALGRTFLPEEDRPGHDRVVILSHSLWQRRFGGDPAIIGQKTTLSGNVYTVVGVMPPAFHYPQGAEMPLQDQFAPQSDIWAPAAFTAEQINLRFDWNYAVIARLRSGVTIGQAQTQLSTIAARNSKKYPQTDGNFQVAIIPMQEQIVGSLKPALLLLLGAAGLVLLIACANVASLWLVRTAARQKEIAIRTALGARPWRIIRQLLTESVSLSTLGGVLGSILALVGIKLLVALAPENIPRLKEVSIDLRAVSYTAIIAMLTGITFGLVPALQASKSDLNRSLRKQGPWISEHRHRIRDGLIVTEMALALVLLIGTGLMIRSIMRLYRVDFGLDPNSVLTVRLNLPDTRYSKLERRLVFYKQVLERIRTLPGVTSVAGASAVPLTGNELIAGILIEGQPPPTSIDETPVARSNVVTVDYFRTMRIPLMSGREFTEHDDQSAPEAVIINEALAHRYFPGESPIDKRVKVGVIDEADPWQVVIGVVHNVKTANLEADPGPEIYVPYLQRPDWPLSLVLRTTSDPQRLTAAARNEIWTVDKDLPVSDIATMNQIISETISQRRFSLVLLSLFAIIALLLAAIGIHGVMTYWVTQRTREIGIRIALGAKPYDMVKMVISQGVSLTLIGVAIGLAAALTLTRIMKSLLFNVSATDPATFALIALLLVGVALIASYLPARRATRVDPIAVLKSE